MTPWWVNVLVAVLSGSVTFGATKYAHHQAAQREESKRRADESRNDRQLAGKLHAAARQFESAMRTYYVSWEQLHQGAVNQGVTAENKRLAVEALQNFRETHEHLRVAIHSRALLNACHDVDGEVALIVHKISSYEQGLAIRLPLPGSTDLLFSGLEEAIQASVDVARLDATES